jgi:hypothetical protein
VTRYKTQPPWEFLLSASRNSLQSYELTRLSHAANLRKEINALLDQWLEENASAMLARWLMEQRARPSEIDAAAPGEAKPNGGPSVSDNFFADTAVQPSVTRGAAWVMAAFRGPKHGLLLILSPWFWLATGRAGVSVVAVPGRQAPLADALLASPTHSSPPLHPASRLQPPALIASSTRLRNGSFIRRHKTA